jgi:hypothetical protein
MVLFTVTLVVVSGLLPSWPSFRQKPAGYLREQTQE